MGIQFQQRDGRARSPLALEPPIIAWSEEFSRKEHARFLGRGLHYPIALDGALKLKEISYIHAEVYPAGELKHGPLALVTEATPVVTVAPNDALLEKLKSNIQEVRARGGELYVFADADTRIVNDEGMHVIRMPEHYGMLSPIVRPQCCARRSITRRRSATVIESRKRYIFTRSGDEARAIAPVSA